jgi:phosphatidylserine decarboxylase
VQSLKFSKILLLQLGLIALSLFVVAEWASNFPYPSPVIKPLLSPRLRWPTEQVMAWIETENIDPSFKKFFYRDPERRVPRGTGPVAAADGLVQYADYRNGVTFLVIGLSFWDVHVVRTPISGTVESIENEGVFYSRLAGREERDVAFFLRGKDAPVQQVVTLRTTAGEVKVRLITSYWASRIKVWAHPGQHLDKGQRVGRILLGSTVIIELPGRVALSVKKGERVTAGETLITENGIAL